MALPIPNFASCEEVLPYIAENLGHLTMTVVVNACAWGLDPGFVQLSNITNFLQSLPPIRNNQLNREQDCQVCFRPLIAHRSSSDDESPAYRLGCGHIIGSECLFDWLETHDTCPHCGRIVIDRPPTEPQQQQLAHERHAQILRGLVDSGLNFLGQVHSGSGMGSVEEEGFDAFRRWAHDRQRVRVRQFVARVHARAHISRLERYLSDD